MRSPSLFHAFAVSTALGGLGAALATNSLSTEKTVSNDDTSLRVLYQNNLNASETNHIGAILLETQPYKTAQNACKRIGETLIKYDSILQHQDDFLDLFSYLEFEAQEKHSQLSGRYFAADGIVSPNLKRRALTLNKRIETLLELPVLCTNTGNSTSSTDNTTDKVKEVTLSSSGNDYVGVRDQKSFRFLGIPYADPPKRFEYAKMYSKKGQSISTTAYGSRCAQTGSGGSEDCLFLNIYTPYIPKKDSPNNLKPVMFWIHGGGFTGGSGGDAGMDGGNLASREDILLVSINYRLSTLGFLAVPDTPISGNFGIADQILALEWTIQNIANFGGDPNRITIVGESAGAASVRVLLGSPKALGKFQGGIAMSNLGGGVGLGLDSDYATTYSVYLSIKESYSLATQPIFAEAGCNQTDLTDQIDCLKAVPAEDLVSFTNVARYVVQDGIYVNSTDLNLVRKEHGTAHVPVIFGNCPNDGASSIPYPLSNTTSEEEALMYTQGISSKWAKRIIDSGVFPYYDTGNLTLDSFNVSQRVATDIQFRCIDQATVYAGSQTGVFPHAFYYQIERTEGGYDPNNVANPPVTPGYPNGNPNLPYFRVHASDVPWLFGGPIVLRDAADLYSLQLVSGYFAEFAKSGQPNPPLEYLRARGYHHTITAISETGPWLEVGSQNGPIQRLDYPSYRSPFQDMAQCDWLNYPIDYYLRHSEPRS